MSGGVDDGREVKQLRVDNADLLPRRHLGALPNWDTNIVHGCCPSVLER